LQTAKIADKDIPEADPEAVLKQYTPWINKMAGKFFGYVQNSGAYDMDDLIQAGGLGLLKAQKTYVPDSGASFLTWSYLPIRYAMMEVLGFREPGRRIPPALMVSMDAPLDEDNKVSLADTIADPNIQPFDNAICEAETRAETAAAVRDAVDRMKSQQQQEVIRRVYLDGQKRSQAAEEMGIQGAELSALVKAGKASLRRDPKLKQYAMPDFHVGVTRFRMTWTSAVEMAVIWREEHLPGMRPDPDD